MSVFIYDSYGNTIFSKKRFSSKTIKFDDLLLENKIEKKKKYTLKLKSKTNEIYKEFYVLFD